MRLTTSTCLLIRTSPGKEASNLGGDIKDSVRVLSVVRSCEIDYSVTSIES